MVPPALVMAIDTLELSPLFKTKVPPARTGFAVTPMPLKPKLVPDTISEVTGVDDSVIEADGDEAKVAVAVAYGESELRSNPNGISTGTFTKAATNCESRSA